MEYAVIWDMDGVLIDSTKISWDSFNEVLRGRGVEFGKPEIKSYLGMSLRDIVSDWNNKYSWNLQFEQFVKDSWAIQVNLLEQAKVDSDLVSLLNQLKGEGIQMGIGTSSQRYRAEKILEVLGIKDYFNTLVTANDIQEHKPSPQIFLEVANRLNISPKRCIVIEDAQNGIEAAKRAEMKVIGYLTQYNDPSDFHRSDLIINSFRELSYESLVKMID